MEKQPTVTSQFIILLSFFGVCSVGGRSFLPVGIFLLFCAVITPLCLWLDRWDRRQNKKLADEFPHDPIIQSKYGTRSEPADGK